jgi:hypothetical protein
MTIKHETFNATTCNERHSAVWKTITAMLVVLGLILTIVGWSLTVTQKAQDQVATAEYRIGIEATKTAEFRVSIKDDLGSLRAWLQKLVDKQDKTNDSVQRLIQQHEQEHREKK